MITMASGDIVQETGGVKRVIIQKCRILPLLGVFLDYINTTINYFKANPHQVETNWRYSKANFSCNFVTFTCFLLGLVSNIKFGVVTLDGDPLTKDLHNVLLSMEEKLYVDDIDMSRMMWCLEASDFLALLFSCVLICCSWKKRSPLREYLFLPWVGITLRGLFLRQFPTAAALIYTISVVQGNVDPVFLTGYSFLLLVEARLWLEIVRLVRARWEKGGVTIINRETRNEVQTLWTNDDNQSVQVQNHFY